MPEDKEDEDNEEQGDAGDGGRSILQLIWVYHPLAMLVLSLVVAGFSYSLLPKQSKEEPKPLSWFYDQSLSAIRRAKNPLQDASQNSVQEDIQTAKAALDYVFRHKRYRDQVDTDPGLVNPYLLFGESLFLYGTHPGITQDELKTFQLAAWAYGEALRWEDKHWGEREQQRYDQQYFSESEPYDERVLAARKLLRKQYTRYMRAISCLKAQQYGLAAEDMDALLQEFRVENLGENENATHSRPVLAPHEFEILPEDRVLLYFYLGQLNEQRGDLKEAEKNYQIFLLHARRSREYFIAMMRLGSFYFEEARQSEKNDPGKARRLYGEAADVFSRVVSASPPGDLLREAYFSGGRAYLNIALLLPVGNKTLWNKAEDFGHRIEDGFSTFSLGNALPERTKAAIPALGRLLSQGGLAQPFPVTLLPQLGAGSALMLASRERLTPLGERTALLRRAKAFFTGSQGGEAQKYDGAAYVMLARTYMIEGDYEKARGLMRYTRSKFWGEDVEVACQLGVAVSYLLEGALDRSFVRFLGGVEKVQPSLLVEYDIKSWTELCRTIFEGSRQQERSPGKRIWGLLPDNIQEIIRNAALTDRLPERFQPILTRKINELLSREDFYVPEDFKGLELPDTANLLLKEDIPLLALRDRQWLNRMLLDATMRSSILPTELGNIIPSFPSESQLAGLNNSVLLGTENIIASLKDLVRAYLDEANRLDEENRLLLRDQKDTPEDEIRLRFAAPRRALEHASRIDRFLVNEYSPADKGDILMENAGILKRRALLAALPPFRNYDAGRKLTSEAADAYWKIGSSGEYLTLEPEALLEAGSNFYASGQYGRASEALARYVQNYPKSSDIDWASNLLGRCYWYQGRFPEAIDVYRESSKRLTPAARSSLYYLGAVFLDARQLTVEKTIVDVLGNPKEPYAHENATGQVTPQTALQVFNEIRRMPGIDPASRPWRWATFGLGRVWYEMAERARLAEQDKAAAENRAPASIEWIPHYEMAEKILREGLERYRLKYSPADPVGISKTEEPEDYNDVMRQRMENEYFLALTQKELAREREEMGEDEVRKHLEDVINLDLYPKNMADLDTTRLLLSNRSVLGVTEGPVVRPRYLETLRHYAFFLLAQSWRDLGLKLEKEDKKPLAMKAYERTLQVYRTARDRLTLLDGPRILYNMGDVMLSLNRQQDARRLFMMAISQVNQLETSGQKEDVLAELLIWRKLSEDRLRDLDNKIGN